MTETGSNVAAEVNARLTRAREQYYLGVECHRRAADEILAAKDLDPSLSYRKIADALGIKSHTTVKRLVDWRLTGADRTTSPFGGDHSRLERAVRQALRDHPDMAVEQVLKTPGLLDRINIEATLDVEEPASEPLDGPTVLERLDTVHMGEHVLVVGDATKPSAKLSALTGAGLPHVREFFDADAATDEAGDGEMDVVVVTDPPYGQDKRGITNDHRANWGEVYSLFKPKGGFVFCAFHPPFFRAAEDGIIQAGGKPVEYLALDKGGGRMWGGDRVQNRLDALIYFERAEEAPWKAGRRAVSLLSPNRSREAREELREIGGEHPTPKDIDVLVKLIELATEVGDTVLDPFTGSGTTLIACERAGRRFIGVEFEPTWADLVVRNWQRETGRNATVDREFGRSGVVFNDLEANPALGE